MNRLHRNRTLPLVKYITLANDSERFYLCLLLTAVKGATSFEDLVDETNTFPKIATSDILNELILFGMENMVWMVF